MNDVDRDAKPVLIKAGALGQGMPSQPLIVSPQHRILINGGGQLMGCAKDEVFAPTKALTNLPGIRHMNGKKSITWVHFACDTHQIVLANGCLAETLLLGPMVPNWLSRRERRGLTAIFGPIRGTDIALNGPPARKSLSVGQARRKIAEYVLADGRIAHQKYGKSEFGPLMQTATEERSLGRSQTRPLCNYLTRAS